MLLYLAGSWGEKQDAETYGFVGVPAPNRLLSFAYQGYALDFWLQRTNPEARLFLDCGAYTAYTKGIEIDLLSYEAFLIQNGSRITTAAALDDIADPEISLANWEHHRAKGLDVVPAFHIGEDEKYLRHYCSKCDYIALGGVVGNAPLKQREFMDSCFRAMREFWPMKVHGYGITANWALVRYPFYSADSASAVFAANMGRKCRFDSGKIKTSHWSKEPMEHALSIEGFSQRESYIERFKYNVKAYYQHQQYLTALWKVRGVVW